MKEERLYRILIKYNNKFETYEVHANFKGQACTKIYRYLETIKQYNMLQVQIIYNKSCWIKDKTEIKLSNPIVI